MMTLKEQIQEKLMLNGRLVPKRCSDDYLKRAELYTLIADATANMMVDRFSDRIKSILNDVYDNPCCENARCSNKVSMTDGRWQRFCSMKCMASSDAVRCKAKETCISRYGVDNPFQDAGVKDKIKLSNLENHGVEYPMQSAVIMGKAIATNQSRYGVDRPLQNKEISDKAIATMHAKFGGHPMANNELRSVIIKANRVKFDSDWYFGSQAFFDWAEDNPYQHSRAEEDIRDYLKELGYDFPHTYKVLKNRQLDGYCEELGLAFEYHGSWYHNEDKKVNNYHYKKYVDCAAQGVRLISIFESEWIHNEKKVKQFLRATVGSFDRRLYARSCEVRSIEKFEAFAFCNQYHMQGAPGNKTNSTHGIFCNDELLGVVTYAPHHRTNTGVTLNRLCFKDGVQIVGGASKLIKNTIVNFDRVTTWSDNRWSSGNVYLKVGFTLDGEVPYDYTYIDPRSNVLINKQSLQKKKIDCPPEVTEHDFCYYALGLRRIYDCGKKRFLWVNKQI